MNTGESILRLEASLCHLGPEPQEIGENVTGLLSDGLPETCKPLFLTRRNFVVSILFIHRILPSHSPRLNVIGRYTNCSPITGLWMYAMDDSGVLQPCSSYIGANVGDFTTCCYRCDTSGHVNYIVVGMSDRRAMPTSETAVICEITMVWGPSEY